MHIAGWWYKPGYVINEMNTNSVITTPGHNDFLPINAITTQRTYTMKGFAYSGNPTASCSLMFTCRCGAEHHLHLTADDLFPCVFHHSYLL